ncbi:hypothetical protein PHYPSEUDO_009136 [Phytophthora pseudosyringae]|uniref:Uncharacterized protein n=1 Tax=Phytophthora pseudosyringae TaxID=221518 RepID=A0A8T1VDA6_9STRA|nr:hypothetical protein PHYPSEUDO_009136 [Phytophthora pseudosyringae]
MVKWLHGNTEAGYTSAAMEQAARNGQLQTLKWLHTNRSKGFALSRVFSLQVECQPFVANKFEIFLFVHAHYVHPVTQAFVQNILGNGMRHNETNDTRSSRGCMNTTPKKARYRWSNRETVPTFLRAHRTRDAAPYFDFSSQSIGFTAASAATNANRYWYLVVICPTA